MFFILFSLSKSLHYLTLPSHSNSLLLLFNPLDVIEVEVPAGFATIFGGWDNVGNLNIEVEMLTKKGKSYVYGPYTNDDEVYGVYFQTANYIIRFMNDNAEKVKFAFRVDDHFLAQETDIFPNYPILYQTPDILEYHISFNEVTDPIIFSYWTFETYGETYGVFALLLASIYIVYNIVRCIIVKCPCKSKEKSEDQDQYKNEDKV